MDQFSSLEKITTECADGNFLYFYKRVNPNAVCYLVSDISEDGVNDVFRFGLQGIVSFFEERDEQLEKQLNDSARHIILYGQKSQKHFDYGSYKYISGVQVDNPVLALNYFSYD